MTKTTALLLALLLVLTACAGGSAPDDSEAATPEARDAGADGDQAADSTVFAPKTLALVDSVPPPPEEEPDELLNLDGTDPGGESLPPTDLVSAVELGAEQGRWSETEGIALALTGLAGWHDPVSGLAPSEVAESNITALLTRAEELEQDSGIDPETADVLAAAIRFFSPTSAVLDLVSEPSGRDVSVDDYIGVDGSSGGSEPGTDGDEPGTDGDDAGTDEEALGSLVPVVYRAQGSEISLECSEIATMGFGVSQPGEVSCYVYDEITIEGNRLRIYYPRAWRGDETQEAKVDLTFEVLTKSTLEYSRMVPVGHVSAIFSQQDLGELTAYVSSHEPGEPCPVTMSASMWAGAGDNTTRQIVAHEVFHCVQRLNYPPSFGQRWLREGTAEYFSNVVYPEFDVEQRWAPFFDSRSTSESIIDMAYEPAIFFQYLANVRGDSAVLDLLEAAGSGDGEGALRSIDGIEELWQDFVVAGVAGAVFDPGGNAWPRLGKGSGTRTISAVGEARFDTEPFVATRYLVDYEKEKRFVQTTEQTPLHAVVEPDKASDLDAWTELPPEIRSECKEPKKLILVTTDLDSGQMKVMVDTVETAACDPCVLGAWNMDLPTFESYMTKVLEEAGGVPAGFTMSFSGNYYAEYKAEPHEARFVRQPLEITINIEGAFPITTSIEGTDTARYEADGERLSVSGLSGTASAEAEAAFSESFSLGASTGLFAMDGPSSGAVDYTCEEDVMVTEDGSRGAITWHRIDEIPEPEQVTVETGQ